ncbi:MAG: glycoside hydrolase family 172 protein [Candidatus Acidiferrum sp.]|jgi:D-arabinan exo alpha-(1,3)/(1,5)-arabinofuranosidase (non-reducing end)
MRLLRWILLVLAFSSIAPEFSHAQIAATKVDLTQPQDYVLKRVSSFDRSGGNADYRQIAPGQTLTVLDADGPATLTHIWFTLSSPETAHLKKLVLRMYWDHESTPSVETPLGDFFGLGLGDYYTWESELLSVAHERALNSFFPMPFQKHALITVSNEGREDVDAFYFNLDYRALSYPLPPGTLYFHAQFRQAQPNHGWTTDWTSNGDSRVDNAKNLDGKDNYVWLEATGQGHYVGVTMSILQNQNGWWGEGDDMFFIDGDPHPSINGTGSEDYFLGAYDFGEQSFSYRLFGAPVKGEERAGGRSSVYRFHLDSPITFTKSLRATIEHGHANHRSDNFYSVAYWYQTEPHAPFPTLPPVEQRLPRLQPVGGPGNAAKPN